MKKTLFLLSLFAVLYSCVSVSTDKPKDITTYQLIDGRASAKTEIKRLTQYAFKKDEKIDFYLFLKTKFDDQKTFDPANFWVTVKDVDFNIQFLSRELLPNHAEIANGELRTDKNRPLTRGQLRGYLLALVTDKQGEDCLTNNSFYKYIVIDYLEKLQAEYYGS